MLPFYSFIFSVCKIWWYHHHELKVLWRMKILVVSLWKGHANRDSSSSNRFSAISRYGDQNISPDFFSLFSFFLSLTRSDSYKENNRVSLLTVEINLESMEDNSFESDIWYGPFITLWAKNYMSKTYLYILFWSLRSECLLNEDIHVLTCFSSSWVKNHYKIS